MRSAWNSVRVNSVLAVCILLLQGPDSLAENDDMYKTKIAVEAVDQTPSRRFGDEQLGEWLREIVRASYSYVLLPRKEAHYLMLGTLKQAQEIVIRNDPAVQVQFEFLITELDPETQEPALMPRMNINRSIARSIFYLSAEQAIKEVMMEAFKPVEGGIAHEHEPEKNIYIRPNPLRHGYPYRTRS